MWVLATTSKVRQAEGKPLNGRLPQQLKKAYQGVFILQHIDSAKLTNKMTVRSFFAFLGPGTAVYRKKIRARRFTPFPDFFLVALNSSPPCFTVGLWR
jgi:hypothetical protein